MKKSKYSILLISVLFLCSACELTEINIDPTRQADVALNLMLPEAISSTAYNQSGNAARVTGIIMQQYFGVDAQQVQYGDYIINEDTWNNLWNTGLYAGSMKSCQVIINKAQDEGQPHYEGIAKILLAEEFGLATSFFGDIPFSQALKGQEFLKPIYDTQESVLQGIVGLLDEAIALLGQPSPAGGPGGDDIIYGGDAASWIRTAQALKGRYMMMMSKKDSGQAGKALAALNQSYTSLSDQANFAFESGQNGNNPLAKFGQERPGTLGIDARLAEQMAAKGDPRQFYYMEDAGGQWNYYNSANPQLVWAQDNSIIPLISYVEVKFLEAEGLQRTGASEADVQQALADAIVASMQQLGIAEADYAAYVATFSDLSGLSGEQKIQRIIEEAYFAYFGYAFVQVWNNFRRTGYPSLTPSPNGTNGFNPSGVVPRRYLYPIGEVTTNKENLDAAKARQNGALLDATLWVFQ